MGTNSCWLKLYEMSVGARAHQWLKRRQGALAAWFYFSIISHYIPCFLCLWILLVRNIFERIPFHGWKSVLLWAFPLLQSSIILRKVQIYQDQVCVLVETFLFLKRKLKQNFAAAIDCMSGRWADPAHVAPVSGPGTGHLVMMGEVRDYQWF